VKNKTHEELAEEVMTQIRSDLSSDSFVLYIAEEIAKKTPKTLVVCAIEIGTTDPYALLAEVYSTSADLLELDEVFTILNFTLEEEIQTFQTMRRSSKKWKTGLQSLREKADEKYYDELSDMWHAHNPTHTSNPETVSFYDEAANAADEEYFNELADVWGSHNSTAGLTPIGDEINDPVRTVRANKIDILGPLGLSSSHLDNDYQDPQFALVAEAFDLPFEQIEVVHLHGVTYSILYRHPEDTDYFRILTDEEVQTVQKQRQLDLVLRQRKANIRDGQPNVRVGSLHLSGDKFSAYDPLLDNRRVKTFVPDKTIEVLVETYGIPLSELEYRVMWYKLGSEFKYLIYEDRSAADPSREVTL
jgi:hypothetical protein